MTYPQWGPQAAKALATFAHRGQVDKADEPYIDHPERVVARLGTQPEFRALSRGERDVAKMVAWLHDVIEDTAVTLGVLEALGCPEEVAWRVWRLTRVPGQQPNDYYVAIADDPITLMVKAADIDDNTDPTRLALLDWETRDRLTKKYAKARAALGLSA